MIGTSNPASFALRNSVPKPVPAVQKIAACGCAALMRAICAATLMSAVLKCSRATIVIDLNSGRCIAALTPFSMSWPLASVEEMNAKRVQPRSLK